MKSIKSFFAIFLLALLFTAFIFPQDKITNGFSVVEYLGTAANSSQKTAYINLSGWTQVDSVVVSIGATNETDIDTINFHLGMYTSKAFVVEAAAAVLYQAVTINIADAATDIEPLFTSNATKLTKAALRGYDGIKAVIEMASSGNDATDPNAVYILWRIYGVK